MRLISTRGGERGGSWTFREATFQGLAPDGGLFTPESLPSLADLQLDSLRQLPFYHAALVVARKLLADELAPELLEGVVRRALDFPIPVVELKPGVHLLELFHGPTLSFKDVGAGFMAHMISALRQPEDPTVTVLVATSGDTGGAVAQAFHKLPGVRVVVLYPEGRVSPRQEAQFTTLGGNVTALSVAGTFDDCQRLVKEAFGDARLRDRLHLTSANSINIARLLPQTFYYVHACAQLPVAQRPVVVSVPSGNFGNLTAGLMARAMGMPISRLVAATNRNDVVPEYLATGVFRSRRSRETISNAMDVGDPSNFARILHLGGHDVNRLRSALAGSHWTDDQTRACIARVFAETGRILDPHTAVGLLGLERELEASPGRAGIALATAHPAKFAEVVEPIIGTEVPVPPSLARALGAPRQAVRIPADSDALRELLLDRS